MTYASIDPVLSAWASERNVVLFNEDGEPGRRFFYLSSPKAETFQVVIEPEQAGIVRIDAHLIETWDADKVHYIWEVPIAKMRQILEFVSTTIDSWFAREE